MKTFNWIRCSVIVAISLIITVSSFWTNPFSDSGGSSSNGITDMGSGGERNCPKWATYFEVADATVDCNNPVKPMPLHNDRLCENICGEV